MENYFVTQVGYNAKALKKKKSLNTEECLINGLFHKLSVEFNKSLKDEPVSVLKN